MARPRFDASTPVPRIHCLSWDPHHIVGSYDPRAPLLAPAVSDEEMLADLRKVKRISDCIRVYHTSGPMERVPALAAQVGLKVMQGVWVDMVHWPERTRREVENGVRLANHHPNIIHLVVGSETQQFGFIPEMDLVRLLEQVRARVRVPVSTADNPASWHRSPRLARATDWIIVHINPFWIGHPEEDAVASVFWERDDMRRRYPGKEVFIGETGWPSWGTQHRRAVPGPGAQARFVTGFLREAAIRGVPYNLLEAFDSPWKIKEEGLIGTSWGIFDAKGNQKFSLPGLLEDADTLFWPVLGLAAGTLGALVFVLLFPGVPPMAVVMGVGASHFLGGMAAFLSRAIHHDTAALPPVVTWGFTALVVLLNLSVLVSAFEAAETLSDPDPVPTPPSPDVWPVVSVHLPVRQEDPSMVLATLESLLALDYPDFEVLVVSNNTPDPAAWEPLRDFCACHPRLRFFHLPVHHGHKAGALNYALRETRDDAMVVAVLDADYQVDPSWLRKAIPHLAGPRVVGVQCPQANRDVAAGPARRMDDEYAGFFRIGMVNRASRNAIILHGTMALLERKALERAGGWAEWSITEDAELGLRLQAAGGVLAYVRENLGTGLVPNTFDAYARQRVRWVRGAMGILWAHRRALFLGKGGLSARQRYSYVAGWLPWIGEATYPLFAVTAVYVAYQSIQGVRWLPNSAMVWPILAVLALKAFCGYSCYRRRVPISRRRALATALTGAGLAWPVAHGVWRGLTGLPMSFIRTDKGGVPGLRSRWVAWALPVGVAALMLVCAGVLLLAGGVDNADVRRWAVLFAVLTLPGIGALGLVSRGRGPWAGRGTPPDARPAS